MAPEGSHTHTQQDTYIDIILHETTKYVLLEGSI